MNNAAGNIIHILADGFLRKQMLRKPSQRVLWNERWWKERNHRYGIGSVPTIDPNKLSILFKTWLELLSEFDAEKRGVMFQTYCMQILANPYSIVEAWLLSRWLLPLCHLNKDRESALPTRYEVLLGSQQKQYKVIPEHSLQNCRAEMISDGGCVAPRGCPAFFLFRQCPFQVQRTPSHTCGGPFCVPAMTYPASSRSWPWQHKLSTPSSMSSMQGSAFSETDLR